MYSVESVASLTQITYGYDVNQCSGSMIYRELCILHKPRATEGTW